MITSREWLQAMLRRPLPDWAQVTNIRFWRGMLERCRMECLSAGADPPDYFELQDPVRRALESDTGVPMEALEEDEPWRSYREPGDPAPTASGADEVEDEEERGLPSRAAEAGRGHTLFLHGGGPSPVSPRKGTDLLIPEWDDAVEC